MRALVLLAAFALFVPAAGSSASEPMPGARVDQTLRGLAGAIGLPDATVAPVACGSLAAALSAYAAYLGVAMPSPAPAVPADQADAIAQLVCALHAASLARDAAYEGVDWSALARDVMSGTEWPAFELTPAHVAVNAAGARMIALAVDDALGALRPAAGLTGGTGLAAPQFEFSPVLAFDLVGQDTYYGKDVALAIDVGGNDVYANNAGGSVIAFGNGPFIPVHGDPSSFGPSIQPFTGGPRVVMGGDFEDAELLFSASLLVDLEGDDTYGVPRTPWHDAVCTSEPVVRKVVIQGSGAGGPGMLFDLGGNNVFRAKTVAQGVGHAGGVGVLYLGEGADTLHAVRLAQGSGLFFGIGLLINEGGDDVYEAKVPAGGVFNTDGGFCDALPRYLHGTGFARVTGAASGVAGALIDLAGNDRYVADTKTIGMAEVASLGLFLDAAGDDVYVAATRSLGFAAGNPSTSGGGLGLFIDAEGDDRYTLRDGLGLGATPGALNDPTHPPAPYAPYTFWLNEMITLYVDPWLIAGGATFFDGEGNDVYLGPATRANGEIKATSVGGVFIDR